MKVKKRTAFMIMLTSLVIASMPCLSACGEEDDGSGGEFFAVIAENPQNLDPQLAADKSSLYVIKNIYATLTDIDGKGEVVNGSASGCTVSEDGRTYTFTLRSGLFWRGLSGGDVPLTAHDYEYAFKRIYTPETKSPHTERFSQIRGAMDYYEGNALDMGVHAVDDYTLEIELISPDCDFLRLLAHPAASPCNKELFEGTRGRYGLSAEDVYCCGAFYVTDWNYDPYWTENRIILERIGANSHEGYRTYPKSLHIEIDGDRAAAELKNNAYCEGYAASCEEYTKEVSRSYEIEEFGCCTSFLMFAPGSAIYEDRGARQALSSVIDRGALAENLGGDEDASANTLAEGVFPKGLISGGASIRELCSGEWGSFFKSSESPLSLWENFKGEHTEIDFNSLFLLISDDYPSPSAAESIVGDFERELGFYCTPVYESPAQYERRVQTGEYDLRIGTVCPDFPLLSDFAKTLLRETSFNAPDGVFPESISAALSDCGDSSAKGAAAEDFEEEFISGAYAIPLTCESKYFFIHKNAEDIWYEPCSETVFYKYAKKYE
ncbi:MAG: ABC transporter substrate-binding protein [Ruminococcus sp.]|nr:ABC transporter substrate-binding protein [Ruminococcus sp.]